VPNHAASDAGTAPESDARLPHAPPGAPRPRSSIAATVLATIASGVVLWQAQDLVLPVLLAMFFALIGNPIIRALRRLWMPRFLAAVLVMLGGLTATGLLANQLVEPAAEWVRQVPREFRELAPKLRDLTKPVREANRAAENFARVAGGESRPVQVIRTEVNEPYRALTATPRRIASVLAVILLTFFFMVYGENMQRNAIALLPSRQQKTVTLEILQSIEDELSRYVLTISVINAVVGLVFAAALYLLKIPLPEALMWGTMAALLNFAPYVGPLIGIAIMLLMGLTEFDGLDAFIPAGIYFGLHTLEAQIVTPIILGRRMRISPLILMLALMVFGALWGIVGLLLAVPLIVCVKLVLARTEGREGWARVLE
jgi:predicted PurR-regulated permease PerM